MPCKHVSISGGATAIVCSRSRPRRCACGRPGTRLCDWKVKTKKSGTCDAAICDRCAHSPAPDKDLCAKHADEWQARVAARRSAA
jgi:hypothetical protein